jgi:serine protease Do
MDDSKNNRDYRHFFSSEKENEPKKTGDEQSSEKKEVYYSYGPYPSSIRNDKLTVGSESINAPSSLSGSLTPMPTGQPRRESYTAAKKRSAFRSMFTSFLAGALVVGSLMFASDKMNLFGDMASISGGGGQAVMNGALANGNEANQGGVNNASLEIVRPNTIADIAAQASPAVVKIETLVSGRQRSNPFFEDDIFRYWFGDDYKGFNEDAPQGKKIPGGMGSGFIFESSGYILTNEHVLSGAEEIYVTVEGHKKKYKAKKLGADYDLDLAVIKIEGSEPFATLKLGDSSEVRVGDWLTAIGNPVGFDHTVSVGVLSAREREIAIPDREGVRKYKHLLQTDASINPGNSGGPLLNLKGEVIGINTAVSAQAQGIGFAIPTSTISEVLSHLKNNEEVPKPPAPYLGIGLRDIDPGWVADLKLSNAEGAIVTQVEFNSPAHKAGLRTYDVIVGINGGAVKNANDLVERIKQSKVNQRITLTIVRDGKKYETAVVIGDRNEARTDRR